MLVIETLTALRTFQYFCKHSPTLSYQLQYFIKLKLYISKYTLKFMNVKIFIRLFCFL